MWMMLQAPKPEDYVIATGETHTVREFLELAFNRLQLDWRKYVKIDSKYYRPTEVDLLIGDASKAKRDLGWEPKVRFTELANMMVDADLAVERERLEGTQAKG
jgi:GDPmannose 4,6-dehydratase